MDNYTKIANQAVNQVSSNKDNINPDLTPDVIKFLDGEEYNASGQKLNRAIPASTLNPQRPLQIDKSPITGPDNSLVDASKITTGGIDSYIASLTPTKTAEQTRFEEILSRYGDLSAASIGQDQFRSQQEELANVPQIKKNISDLNNLILTANAEYERMNAEEQSLINKIENKVIPLEFQQGEIARVQRINNANKIAKASEIGMYTARLQAQQGNLQTAFSIADKAVATKYRPIEDELKILDTQLKMLQPILDQQEKTRAIAQQAIIRDRERALEEAKANERAINEIVIQASAQGAPIDLVNQASNSKTPLEASRILGKYSGDYLKYELLKEQIKTEKAQQAPKVVYSSAGSGGSGGSISSLNVNPAVKTSKYTPALNVILGSSKLTKDQKNDVKEAINNGEDPVTVIKNRAKDIMGQTEANKLANYEVAKAQIEAIKSNLDLYYKNNGKTGVFSGNFEKTLNKLGEVNDPKLVEIAVQISGALQLYKNAVSGTAYSVQEEKDINSIFPGINKAEGLNNAIIKGRINAFNSIIDGTYKNVLGSSYETLKDSTPSNLSSLNVANNDFMKALGGLKVITYPNVNVKNNQFDFLLK